jgi:hypothetical protein
MPTGTRDRYTLRDKAAMLVHLAAGESFHDASEFARGRGRVLPPAARVCSSRPAPTGSPVAGAGMGRRRIAVSDGSVVRSNGDRPHPRFQLSTSSVAPSGYGSPLTATGVELPVVVPSPS